MSEELRQINNTLIKLCVKVDHIKENISDMKVEREKHKDTFWKNMNTLKQSLYEEKEERIKGDNIIEKEMTSLKTKVGIITVGITTGLTAMWQLLKKSFE